MRAVVGCVERGLSRTKWLNGAGEYIEDFDLLPCPKCSSLKLEIWANVVECSDCEHCGPAQDGPEFICDWREAIWDWNREWAQVLVQP